LLLIRLCPYPSAFHELKSGLRERSLQLGERFFVRTLMPFFKAAHRRKAHANAFSQFLQAQIKIPARHSALFRRNFQTRPFPR
jgi:hypothetical protein